MNSKKTNLVGNPIYITDTYIKIFVEDGTVNKTWRHTPAPGTDKSLFPSFSCQHRINRDNSSCYNTSNSALSKLFSTTYGEENAYFSWVSLICSKFSFILLSNIWNILTIVLWSTYFFNVKPNLAAVAVSSKFLCQFILKFYGSL